MRYTGVLDQPLATVTIDCTSGPVEALLAQPTVTGATTIAAGSDGAELPQATINVASTIGTGADDPFATSGVIFVESTLGGVTSFEQVAYTGKTNTSFTTCTGGTGIIATGNRVVGNHVVAWTGVDRWLTTDGQPPVLATLANAVDHFYFENVGGVVHGRHKSGPGLPGARGSTGPVGLQNRGTYAPGTAYVLNDVVTYLGSTYVCIQAGTGQTPNTLGGTAYWDLMALAGADGPPPIIIENPPGTPGTSLDTKGIAAQLVMWGKADPYAGLTDAQLGYLGNATPGLGLKGIVLKGQQLYGSGGSQNYTGDPTVDLSVAGYGRQRGLRDGNYAARARSKGIDLLYISAYAVNYNNTQTVFSEWFDDAGWSTNTIPAVRNWAGAARLLGFNGIAFDCEEYPGTGNSIPTWHWAYPGYATSVSSQTVTTGSKTFATQAGKVWAPGDRVRAESPAYPFPWLEGAVTSYSGSTLVLNVDTRDFGRGTGPMSSANWWISRPEAQVRPKIKQRGQEMMQAILDTSRGYGPNVDILLYAPSGAELTGGWNALLQYAVNGKALDLDHTQSGMRSWLDGMLSVPGYGRFRFTDSTFFYGSGLGNDATAMIINANGTLAYLSQNLSNWAYANARVSVTPFMWLGPSAGDGSSYTANSSPTASQATSIVADARKYGMSGQISNYDNGGPFPPNHAAYIDYTSPNGHISHGNFEAVFQSVTAGVVDTTDPALGSIVVTRDNATTVHATGTATDNFGVRAIRWFRGPNSGAAVHTFVPDTTRVVTPSTGPMAGIPATVPDYTLAPGVFAWHVTWIANGIPATAGQTITFAVEDIKGRVATYDRVAPA